jgi:hypothetical protein
MAEYRSRLKILAEKRVEVATLFQIYFDKALELFCQNIVNKPCFPYLARPTNDKRLATRRIFPASNLFFSQTLHLLFPLFQISTLEIFFLFSTSQKGTAKSKKEFREGTYPRALRGLVQSVQHNRILLSQKMKSQW